MRLVNQKEVCSICGLFGLHKNHKITTGVELKKLNEEILKTNRDWLKGVVDIKEIEKSESLSRFVRSKADKMIGDYKKSIFKVYEEVKSGVKKRFLGFVNKMEDTINKYIDSVIDNNNEDFFQFIKLYKKIDEDLKEISERNKEKNIDLFEIFNGLKKMETEIESIELRNKKLQFFKSQIDEMNVSVNYNKNYLGKLISLNMKDIKIKKSINVESNSLLFNTISVEEEKNLDKIIKTAKARKTKIEKVPDNNISLFGNEETNSVSEENFTLKRSKSLLKKNFGFSHHSKDKQLKEKNLFNKTKLKNLSIRNLKMSEHSSPKKLVINTYSGIESIDFEESSFNLSPVKKGLNELNIYNPNTSFKLMSTNPNNKLKLKKMNTMQLSPSSINYELSQKNSTLSIKDRDINPTQFKKILSDAFSKKKIIEKLVFRDNFFSFDVLSFLKSYFSKPLKSRVEIDLRKNKMKKNFKMLDFLKKHLRLHNVKVVV